MDEEKCAEANYECDDFENSTYFANLNLFGLDFQVSDRVDGTGDFSDSVNFMVNFTRDEEELFRKYIELAKTHNEKIIYDNTEDHGHFEMFRFKDKMGLI
jgi:hypothetical protein